MKLRYHLLHFRPHRIEARVRELREAGVIDVEPNLWQLWMGVLYMWHRAAFRPETIGLSTAPVRETARARWFAWRPARSPFLFAGRRVNPLDHTGLGSTTAHTVRHLVGAHHDAADFHFDLQLIAHEPGVLTALEARVRGIVEETAPDAVFLKDLCVYEGYHEALLEGVQAWIRGDVELDHANPDATLTGFLRWCAQQPRSLRETLRTGLPDFTPRLEAA
ncbi:MAG: hypothetical protein R3F61_17585 [Myxococcota bacterium]